MSNTSATELNVTGRTIHTPTIRGDTTIRAMQLNCQRCEAVMLDVIKMMDESVCDVWLLQEPFIRGNRIYGLGDAQVFMMGDHPKAAVVITRDDVQGQIMRDISSPLACFVRVWAGGVAVLMGSIYCQYGAEINDSLVYFEAPVDAYPTLPIIMGLDANATSALRYSKNRTAAYDRDRRGDVLAEHFLRRRWHVLNTPSNFFTFAGPNGYSDIDVSICNDRLIECFAVAWRIRPDLGVSDHNPIFLELIRRGGQDVGENDRAGESYSMSQAN